MSFADVEHVPVEKRSLEVLVDEDWFMSRADQVPVWFWYSLNQLTVVENVKTCQAMDP